MIKWFATLAMLLCVGFAQLAQSASEKPLYQLDNAAVDARIRATFTDADPFAGAKVVGLMFADRIDTGRKTAAAPDGMGKREDILEALVKESAAFRKIMPDFRIAERDLFVSDNGVVMTGRMMGTRQGGQPMDTSFATIFVRDKSGQIISQRTLEVAHKPAATQH